MRNSASKTFHFRPKPEDVLNHLCRCPVCLSSVTVALDDTVDLDALALVAHVQRCLKAETPGWRRDYRLT